MFNASVLRKWQMSGEMFLCPKVLPGDRILLSKFQTLTSSIIESVDSISRDERDAPLTQYITNAGITRARYTIVFCG